jgi:hypothetical protein
MRIPVRRFPQLKPKHAPGRGAEHASMRRIDGDEEIIGKKA